MERVVSQIRVEANLQIVLASAVPVKQVPDLVAEVTLDLKHESARTYAGIVGAEAQDLLRVWVHAAAGLASTNGAKNRNSCVQTTFRNGEPLRSLSRFSPLRVVHLAQHHEKALTYPRCGICRKFLNGQLAVLT